MSCCVGQGRNHQCFGFWRFSWRRSCLSLDCRHGWFTSQVNIRIVTSFPHCYVTCCDVICIVYRLKRIKRFDAWWETKTSTMHQSFASSTACFKALLQARYSRLYSHNHASSCAWWSLKEDQDTAIYELRFILGETSERWEQEDARQYSDASQNLPLFLEIARVLQPVSSLPSGWVLALSPSPTLLL